MSNTTHAEMPGGAHAPRQSATHTLDALQRIARINDAPQNNES